MKAVILAAGLSSRIRSVTNGSPKCLLRFGDRTILDFQIESLFDAGIESLAIVTGYGQEHIVEHVGRQHPEKRDSIRLILNPKFATTNNIYSLWLAREWVRGSSFVCLNADVLFHPEILLPAVRTRADISMIVDEKWREETMKVIIRGQNILAMSKQIARSEASGTYLGITTFSRRVWNPLFSAIEGLLQEGRVDVFFNVAVERLIAAGQPVMFTKTKGLPWAEIDDANDLRFAREQVYPHLAAGLERWFPSSALEEAIPHFR